MFVCLMVESGKEQATGKQEDWRKGTKKIKFLSLKPFLFLLLFLAEGKITCSGGPRAGNGKIGRRWRQRELELPGESASDRRSLLNILMHSRTVELPHLFCCCCFFIFCGLKLNENRQVRKINKKLWNWNWNDLTTLPQNSMTFRS